MNRLERWLCCPSLLKMKCTAFYMCISPSGHRSVDSLIAVCRNVGILLHAPVAVPEVESMGRSADLKIPKAPSPCHFPQWLPRGCHFKVSPRGKADSAVDRAEEKQCYYGGCKLSGVTPEEKTMKRMRERRTAMMERDY